MTAAPLILVADDEPMIRRSLRMLLTSAGFDVEEAPNSEEALEKMQARRPSLLISDINMPGNDHLEFVKSVADAYPGLPVIMLTAFPSVETAIESVNLSVVGYFVKPPNADELLAAVSASIGHYEARGAVERALERIEDWKSDLHQVRQLATSVRKGIDANSAGAYLEVTIRHMMESLTDMREVVAVLASSPSGVQSVRSLELVKSLQETVAVLEKTKRLFKSKDLGELRQKLEAVLASVNS